MAGSAGKHLSRTHKGSRRKYVILYSRHRESRAAHEHHLGCGPDFIDSGAGVQGAARFTAIRCDGNRRGTAWSGYEFIHASARRRQDRCPATFATFTRTRGVDNNSHGGWTKENLGLAKQHAPEAKLSRSLHRHAEFGSFSLKPGIELLDHLLGPRGVDLAGR